MTIIKTVTLVAAPPPDFIGTKITVEIPDGGATWGIFNLTKATESDCVSVKWGDGEETASTGDLVGVTHDYAEGGIYEVLVSDDAEALCVSTSDSSAEVFRPEYAPMVREVRYVRGGTGSELTLAAIGDGCFCNATALVSADFNESRIAQLSNSAFDGCSSLVRIGVPASATMMRDFALRGCAALGPRIALPGVDLFTGWRSMLPFADCTSLTEIHFAAANEAAIKESAVYRYKSHLGAPWATIMFDL